MLESEKRISINNEYVYSKTNKSKKVLLFGSIKAAQALDEEKCKDLL